ncbi:glycoside hydrolase family 104 protein [Paraburkholderia sp. UYCP14C]|uniref:glycoside hydrolase family 24 protein n=1 Tax=Paraburkholderia sp. UYCP14C TaxID=2511130 RepID=UPI00200707A7|nr:glycoside hydrolase family 104 protein [Paraburkholderia sp. UYCP14C]
MASKPAPHHPQTSQAPALKQLAFTFPFLRKTQGNAGASVRFTDEHEIYRLLAASEPSGAYLVSRKGMWHGGIHITEAGAGKALDLDAGLRCIADGVLIAYRANRDYPVSEVALGSSNAPFEAPYSTGFALVRHEMEFPRGTKLTFYSLYMHLMSNADYDSNFPKRQKPAYWSRQRRVTEFAQDRPQPGRSGQVADLSQVGLHVRRTLNGSIVGILPQGASVSIGKTETVHGATWGQLTDLNGATLYAPEAGGYVEPSLAVNGWIYLGAQNGGPVAKESIPESMFDRVILTTDQACKASDPQGTGGGVPIKAGDLIGHLGRYDSLSECSSGTRMAHIEVFCDEGIKPFIKAGRAWVNTHVEDTPAVTNQWNDLGVSPEPTILRVNRGTKLYQTHANGQPGKDPKQTDVIQVYQFAALPQDDGDLFMEKDPGNDGTQRRWWKVDSADALRNPISGWVREQSFEGGRVTRENAQSWIDFVCHDEDHDPTHTIFTTTGDYVDYALGRDMPGAGSLGRLSPLMGAIYRVLYPTGDGPHAADDLCNIGQSVHGSGFPWAAFRASRLIPKHESEWANPTKWQALVSAIEERTGPKAEHEEEKKRIAKLVWWDEVAARVPGFPRPNVYHINPIGLVGNFSSSSTSLSLAEARVRALLRVIRVGEGTSTDRGYTTLYGGGTFQGFADHPRKKITAGKYTSTAAGAYQILEGTWDGLVSKKQYSNFDPESQDRAAVQLLMTRHVLNPIIDGDLWTAILGSGGKAEGTNKEWASQPDSPYGQPVMTMDRASKLFAEYLEDELRGHTTLTVPQGELLK